MFSLGKQLREKEEEVRELREKVEQLEGAERERVEWLKNQLEESENIRASLGEQVAELERALVASRRGGSSSESQGRGRGSSVAHKSNRGFKNWAVKGKK